VGDRRQWDAQVDQLAERYRVLCPDLRGFGDTPLPGEPFSYVDDQCASLAHLGIERAAVVGNSLGGRVALELTIGHPKLVAALVLVGSGLGLETSEQFEAFDAEEDALLDEGKLDEAVELNMRMWVGDVDPGRQERIAAMQRRSLEVIFAAYENDPPPGPVGWIEPPAHGRLGEIAVPTLVLVGDQDIADIHENADRLAAGIPRARKVVMKGAKHLPAFERPEEFNGIVLDFLAAHYPS
jgi:pimeloyl-ACP methyl ester carboxylesterase